MRFLLIALAAVLFALGWTVGKVAVSLGWCWAAVLVGWDQARTLRPVRTG